MSSAELLEVLMRSAAEDRLWASASMAAGALFLVLALLFALVWARPLAVGAAWVLAPLGLVHVASGATTFIGASRELLVTPEVVREAPHLLEVRREDARAAAARASVLRIVDGVMLVVGLLLLTRRGHLRGAGLALALASGLGMTADLISGGREETRLAALERALQTD